MSELVISVENISKSYQLGVIGTGTFRGDVQRWWAKLRGLPDPFLKIGEKDHGNRVDETVWALKDVSFQVQQGEAVGIIGRNGAGKSTLLKILSRVTAPTSGEVKVKGRIASLLEVGTGFHPELTGRENIFLNGAILGMSRREIGRKFDEIVEFSGVEKYIDTPVKRYSSGMYVRLAFAVAAHLEPDILIVDEVLAVGDVEFQRKCLGKMESVTGEGRTVLFVSHNMLAIRSLCAQAILLDHGEIRMEGDSESVISQYLNTGTLQNHLLWKNPHHAPGDDVARLRALRIRTHNGSVEPVTYVDKPFFIEVEVWKLTDVEKCDIALSIFNQESIRVFASGTLTLNLGNETSKTGVWRFQCLVPGNLLNTGIYRIALIILKDGKTPALKMPEAFSFEVRETPELRAGHYGDWLGVVRPNLAWDVKFLEEPLDDK